MAFAIGWFSRERETTGRSPVTARAALRSIRASWFRSALRLNGKLFWLAQFSGWIGALRGGQIARKTVGAHQHGGGC